MGHIGDGRCIIEPQLWHGYTVGVASQHDIVFGGLYVIDDCVDKRESQGGLVWDIGMYVDYFTKATAPSLNSGFRDYDILSEPQSSSGLGVKA